MVGGREDDGSLRGLKKKRKDNGTIRIIVITLVDKCTSNLNSDTINLYILEQQTQTTEYNVSTFTAKY